MGYRLSPAPIVSSTPRAVPAAASTWRGAGPHRGSEAPEEPGAREGTERCRRLERAVRRGRSPRRHRPPAYAQVCASALPSADAGAPLPSGSVTHRAGRGEGTGGWGSLPHPIQCCPRPPSAAWDVSGVVAWFTGATWPCQGGDDAPLRSVDDHGGGGRVAHQARRTAADASAGDVTDSHVLARLLCDLPRFTLEEEQTPSTIGYGPACHGVWLDGGAFRKIIAARMHELDRKSASEYRQAILPGPDGVLSAWCDCHTVSGLLQYRFFVAHPKLLHTLTFTQRGMPLR